MVAAGLGWEDTRVRGDCSDDNPIDNGIVGSSRITIAYCNAFDAVGEAQTERVHDVRIPQAGALHGPPDESSGCGPPTYHSAIDADTHFPSVHTSSDHHSALRDLGETDDADPNGSAPQPVDINTSAREQWADDHHLVHVPRRCRRRAAYGPDRHRRRPRMHPGLGWSARPRTRPLPGSDRYRQRGELLVPHLVKRRAQDVP